MAKKVKNEVDFDDDDGDGEITEDLDELESKLDVSGSFTDARRRLEQLREEKELERLINGKYEDQFNSY